MKKRDYCQPPWISDRIKRSLKEGSILTRCKSCQKKSDHEKLL